MITIVTGLPRSGTSLMMQMLEAAGIPILSDGIRTADESNPKGYYEYDKTRRLQKDNSWMAEAEGKAVKVIVQLLPFLPRSYDYCFILMHRPIPEVIQSQNRMLERLGRSGASISLEPVFNQQLNRARQWLNRQSRVSEMSFHDLVQDPEPNCKKLEAFLGLKGCAEQMMRVIDPGLWREKQSS